ncbi:hypothetical protein ACVLV4_000846 [Rathayibacter agropyri]
MDATTSSAAPTARDNASVTAADRSQVFHSWSAQGALTAPAVQYPRSVGGEYRQVESRLGEQMCGPSTQPGGASS